MGWFKNKFSGFFGKRYTPHEALSYLATKSAWFATQKKLLKGRRPVFKRIFLKLIPSENKLTPDKIEEYAKKAMTRITLDNGYDWQRSKQQAQAIGKAKRKALAKERSRFEATMAAAFHRQDKLVQNAVQICGHLVSKNLTANNKKVRQAAEKVKHEVRALEHDMVRVIRRNHGIGHEEAAVMRDALRTEVAKWEAGLVNVDKWVKFHLSDPKNYNARRKSYEMLQLLNQQISKSMQEYAAIERVQFRIKLVEDERKQKSADIVRFPVKKRRDRAA
tara:strand:- start:2049 stop:2876 length:828 start_codon:yes stop_codon:yes gene_type:complete